MTANEVQTQLIDRRSSRNAWRDDEHIIVKTPDAMMNTSSSKDPGAFNQDDN